MAIRLYNTKTRQKEDFTPIDPSNVRMYVCGPTVYDRAHIGNARPVVVFDVLYRLLRHAYGAAHVKYARNFTDVDDKINAKSAETGRSIRDITNETINWYHEDMDALGTLRPDHEPRATEYIAPMVAMIEDLIAKGHAYEAEGHVLFAVSTDADYGTLSRRSLDEMRAGARVEVAPYKRDPMDFVLWKPSTGQQPGWDSPWGVGRPGWHIECSAMAGTLFGDRFDIHGGGIDLQFPHHENECAQSRCAGHDFANIWMHNGYLMVEGEKMSKSLGNFFTVADLREMGVPGGAMRLAMLMTHYRSPIDWTQRRLKEANAILLRWSALTRDFFDEPVPDAETPELFEALSNDLNFAKARSVMDNYAKAAASGNDEAARQLATAMNFLGFTPGDTQPYTQMTSLEETFLSNSDPESSEAIEHFIKLRDSAKAVKDYAKADSIRKALEEAGIEIKDTPQGAKWSLTPAFSASKLAELSDV